MLSTTIEKWDKVINCLQKAIERLESIRKSILELKEWLGIEEAPKEKKR